MESTCDNVVLEEVAMQDKRKTKGQLIAELEALRQRLEQVEELLAKCQKAEEPLKDGYNLSSVLLNAVAALIVVLDREGRIIRFNRACEETTGYNYAEVKNKHIWDTFLRAEEVDKTKALFHQLLSGDLSNTYENYWVTRDGNLRLIAWSNTALVKNGQVEFVIGTGIDITEREKVDVSDIAERKQAEEALRNSNKRTIDILESISDGFFALDKEMVVTYFNRAAAKLLGRDRTEVLGRKLFDAFPEARGSVFERKYSEALRESKFIFFETYFERKPYKNWYEVRVFPYEGGISVYFQVITKRKRGEEELREAQRDLNRAQALGQMGSWRLDLRRNELVWSEETYRMFGIAPDTPLTYEAFLSIVHPENREFVDREWTAALGGKAYDIEHRIVVRETVKWCARGPSWSSTRKVDCSAVLARCKISPIASVPKRLCWKAKPVWPRPSALPTWAIGNGILIKMN